MPSIWDGLAALLVKVGQIFLNLGVALLLAHFLEPEGYGLFALVMGLSLVFSMIANLGIPTLLVRELPRYAAMGRWSLFRGIFRWAYTSVLSMSLVLSIALWLGAKLYPARAESLQWTALFVPLYTLLFLQRGMLQGLGHPILAQYPRSLFTDGIFLTLFFIFRSPRNVTLVLLLYWLSLGASVGLSFWWIRKFFPSLVEGQEIEYRIRPWLFSALPMLFIGGSGLVHQQIPVVLTGFFVGKSAAGVVDVVLRGALLVGLPLMAVNIILAPKIAALFVQHRTAEIQRLLRFHVRWAFFLALILAGGLVVFRFPLLEWLGQGYTQGASGLLIAVLGQLINVASGSVVTLLNMSGLEREALKGQIIGVGLTCVSGLILIPWMGVEGGIWAYVSGLVLLNLFLIYSVRQRLALHPSIIG